MNVLRFPKNFYWGTATSAHQVEGDNFNSDWWEWEQKGNIANKDISGKACDFWNRYKEDLKLAKKLGQNAFRFSIEWARIQPSNKQINPSTSSGQANEAIRKEDKLSLRGVKRRSNLGAIDRHANTRDDSINSSRRYSNNERSFDYARDDPTSLKATQGKQSINWEVIKHYQDVLDHCRKLGLEPFVTLHHFTNPKWFADDGGWTNKKSPELFADYVKIVAENIRGVKFWLTINEPLIYAANSYLRGIWPPQARNPRAYARVIKNLIKAHKLAYDMICKFNLKARVGIAKNNQFFEPQNKLWDPFFVGYIAKKWNHEILAKIKNKLDFIGLNYYFHNKLHFNLIPPFMHRANQNKIVSDIGWEVYPEGIYQVLKDLKKYNLPIYITENGVADSEDKIRSQFIVNHLKYVHKAIKNGVNVRGYFYWSLMDNFEWNRGFLPRFGLIKIDYKTQERTIRSSARVYAKICKEGVISEKI